MNIYSFTAEDLSALGNEVKDLISQTLAREGVDTTPIDNMLVIVSEKSWFGKLKSRLRGDNKKEGQLVTVVIRLKD